MEMKLNKIIKLQELAVFTSWRRVKAHANDVVVPSEEDWRWIGFGFGVGISQIQVGVDLLQLDMLGGYLIAPN
jgi:hypothetical protein